LRKRRPTAQWRARSSASLAGDDQGRQIGQRLNRQKTQNRRRQRGDAYALFAQQIAKPGQ
jgi:hypothetical protein